MIRRVVLAGIVATVLGAGGMGQASTVAGVYNTGVAAGGVALTSGNGQVDAHYTIVGGTAWEATIGASARTYAEFDWFAPDTTAAHAINATGTSVASSYATTIYRTSFDLTGYDVATAVITGAMQADDHARVELNGHDLGILARYDRPTNFAASNPDFFAATINHLDFVVSNNTGHTALRVTGLTLTAEPTADGVPEPANWALLATGFGLVGNSMRRRRPARA